MKDQLLLCVDASACKGLKEGVVYTFRADVTCPCGKGMKTVAVEEASNGFPAKMKCIRCGQGRMLPGYPWRASRFIPINDPNALPDEIERKEKEPA